MFIGKLFLKGTGRIINQQYATNASRVLTTSLLLLMHSSSHYNSIDDTVVKCNQMEDLNSGTDAGTDAGTNVTDNEYNEEEDKSCPFCRYFLDSPCRIPFRNWRLCVKNAENPTMCMDPFFPLKKCMDENGMLFESQEDDNIDTPKGG